MINSFLLKSPTVFSPYSENTNVDLEKVFSSVTLTQDLFMYSKVDYSSIFDFKKIKKSQISVIEGIEIYLGNKKVLLMTIVKRNENFLKLIELFSKRKEILHTLKNSHDLIAEKGISALDKLDSDLKKLNIEIEKEKDRLFSDEQLSQIGVSKDELENLIKNFSQ